MVGRYRVEIARSDHPALDELPLIPAAALDECALRRLRSTRTHGGDDVGNALHRRIAHIEQEEAVGGATTEMRVGIDQARRHGAALQVDATRARSGDAQHIGVRADGDYAIPANGDGRPDMVRRIDRDDAAVVQDEVGRWCRRLGGGGAGYERGQRGRAERGTTEGWWHGWNMGARHVRRESDAGTRVMSSPHRIHHRPLPLDPPVEHRVRARRTLAAMGGHHPRKPAGCQQHAGRKPGHATQVRHCTRH